eukprot:4902437-Alexandrium_andersonii.AAC.1
MMTGQPRGRGHDPEQGAIGGRNRPLGRAGPGVAGCEALGAARQADKTARARRLRVDIHRRGRART